MNFLFVHQNFPGQFRHVAKALADGPGNRVIGIGDDHNVGGRPVMHHNLKVVGYRSLTQGNKETHPYLREFEGHVRRGQSVARVALHLKEQGFCPDVIVAHPAWGDAMFLRDVFPDARHINYFEYYYYGTGGDLGFDPEFPDTLDDQLRVRVKNSTQLLSLVSCNQGLSPTQWQKQQFPAEFQSKIQVIHEGIDTQIIRPDGGAWIEVSGRRFKAGDEVVTYVARNLEPYRGFHIFLRALPALLAKRPAAHVLIVGGDEVSYGRHLPEGQSYRRRYCQEIGRRVDWSRVHFVGQLPYAKYLSVLQISAAHVYLTYPFVLSWSMLEAMAAGCALVASATGPVREVIRDGENGLLFNFFDAEQLACSVAEILARPDDYKPMRERARQTVAERYDLRTHCLPQMLEFLNRAP